MTSFSVQDLPEQPYVAVVGHVTMTTIAAIADRFGEVLGWLAERGVAPAGAPFFRYRVIDMAAELVIEAAVPVAEEQTGSGEVIAEVLPPARYVTARHRGHPDELEGVTAELLRWAADRGLVFDVRDSDRGEVWGARLEIYETDPEVEPDLHRWETRLAFRLDG